MSIADIFELFASDFELTVQDDDWSRLKKYFADDAIYLNVGDPNSKCEGRDAILAFLKADVSNNDRRFNTRQLTALTQPKTIGNRLYRQWRSTYTLAGTPDLVVEGEARYLFDGDLIKSIEEELSPASFQIYSKWMQQYGDKLQH